MARHPHDRRLLDRHLAWGADLGDPLLQVPGDALRAEGENDLALRRRLHELRGVIRPEKA